MPFGNPKYPDKKFRQLLPGEKVKLYDFCHPKEASLEQPWMSAHSHAMREKIVSLDEPFDYYREVPEPDYQKRLLKEYENAISRKAKETATSRP